MSLNFIEINNADYESIKAYDLFKNNLGARRFGLIYDSEFIFYKFSWQSEINAPKLAGITEYIYCLGIDLNFSIFDIRRKCILLNIELKYFFYDIIFRSDFIYIASELEVTKISKNKLIVINRYDLPDYFDYMYIEKNKDLVKCVNGEVVVLH